MKSNPSRDGLIKVLIKVLDENQDSLVWEHVCYAPRELYLEFLNTKGLERFEMADCIATWAANDFNVDLPMATVTDVAILRELVLDKYSSAYPHLMRRTNTDRQGWIRVWLSSHMEKELQKR